MATCCTGHGDSGRIRFSRDSGWPRSERQRERERRRIGGLIVTGIASKLDHSWRPFRILLIPGIAVARYRTCAHPACTPRETASMAWTASTYHIVVSLSLSLSLSLLHSFGRSTRLLSNDLASIDETCARQSLQRCTTYSPRVQAFQRTCWRRRLE